MILNWIRREVEHRRAQQARLIRMQALLDTERDCRRRGIELSPEIQVEIDELFGTGRS